MATPAQAAPLDRDACYRAVRARDARFDGRFYTAVLSTGIFCRPICPARTPRPEHCVFYRSAAAAQAAGFRPCLRCRPEIAPGVAGWRGTANTVSRALALIAEGALGEDGHVEDLAERVGVGARHLRRLFDLHLGAPPIAVAQAHRVLFAKKLVEETALPMVEVAVASGFGSVRRFNHAIRRTFGRPPGALRRGPTADPGEGLRLRLPCTAPYDWPALLAFLGARAIPGVEAVEAGRYRRTVELGGAAGTVEVGPAHGRDGLVATLRLEPLSALPAVAERLRRALDLDADAQAIAEHLARDPLLAPLVQARPGLRVPGAWDPFELAVRAILGQQVSVLAARTLAGRLVAACGRRISSSRPGEPGWLFPAPRDLLAADLTSLGLTRARAAALRGLAEAILEDPSLLSGGADLETSAARLQELPGVGPWTAQYIAMRALREPDAFPATDLGLLRAVGARGGRATPARLLRRAARWRPWRAYAVMHLWTSDGTEDGRNSP